MALPAPSQDSTALITGASSGFGVEIAREFAKRGHGVTLVARRAELLHDLADELSDEHGIRAEPVAADLTDAGQRDHLAKRVEELGLRVAILVNNAGYGGFGPFIEQDQGSEVRMVALNVEAVVDLTGRYLPAMVRHGTGAVLNVASTAAFQPMPDNATYAATKAFVLSHSEALHTELKGTGVTMTVVCPGPSRTGFSEAMGNAEAGSGAPEFVWTAPEEIAAQAVSGLERGKRTVVPGWFNTASAIAGRHTPRAMLLPTVKKVWNKAN